MTTTENTTAHDELLEATAAEVLVAHQRHGIAACLCGWSILGKSHADHQAAMLAPVFAAAQAEILRVEAARWDAEYASPINRTCPACGAKPGKNCFGSRPMSQAHSQRRGERITPASLRARAAQVVEGPE